VIYGTDKTNKKRIYTHTTYAFWLENVMGKHGNIRHGVSGLLGYKMESSGLGDGQMI
jgi:hypothetical protein